MNEERRCPHCGSVLEEWIAPPETGWGALLVCNSNECEYFLASNDCLTSQGARKCLGYRYAEDPLANHAEVALVAYFPPNLRSTENAC